MTTTAPGPDQVQPRIPAARMTGDNATVHQQLGLLSELSGTWKGSGFNLIARPDFHDKANLYLQLNQTRETLTINPIGSPIPNRGFGQDDITLFGLNYLQQIDDAAADGALHFEPGLWVTQPPTTYPAETAPAGEQLIFRLGSIPHGNALLAQGVASTFSGPPVVKTGRAEYAFSAFPSFNSTPYPLNPPKIRAAGSSEAETAKINGVPPFNEYNLADAPGPGNPRTPFDTTPQDPPLPASINGVPMQTVVNDPITLLQAVIADQQKQGATFSGVALNISTAPAVTFFTTANSADNGATTTVTVPDAGGSIGNIPFLDGTTTAAPGAQGPNAQTGLVYATFWIEKVTPKYGSPFMQLQYAQFTALDFPIFSVLHPTSGTGTVANIAWPHVSVATLRKSFG